jgi:WD40 repeat protein
LADKSTNCINNPKFEDKGIDFSSTGNFMALIEEKETKDYIGIYCVEDWSLIYDFPVDSYDLQDVRWSKDNTALIAWDNCLECRFFVYYPTGTLIKIVESYKLKLGIKNLSFSPNGKIFSIGFYDKCVRLYNLSWELINEFSHSKQISNANIVNKLY